MSPDKVELRDVVKAYGSVRAVDNVSLKVAEGELVALLGPSGCGKTTTLRMVAGFVEPTAGDVFIGGERVTHLPPYRRDTGMVFQSYALFPHMTVAQNVAFGLKRRGVSRRDIGERVQRMVDLMQLSGLEARLPGQLSGGQQQRVAVARALVINPEVVLLDEPFSNLDAQLRESTRLELRKIQKELNLTTLFVTHDQAEAMAIADRVAVMRAGRIVQIDAPDAVYNRPRNRFVASFVGHANIIEARASGVEGAGTRLRAEGAELFIDERVEGDATVILRPESITLGDSTDPAPNRILGTVESVSYLGPSARIGIKYEGGSLLAEVNGIDAGRFRQGARVSASWPSSALWRLEHD